MVDDLVKSCPSCGYPTHAGHAKDCPTRTSESDEMREEGYQLFLKFLEKHGIDKMTKEEKVAKIREFDFDELMQIISRINGRLNKRDKTQEWTGEAAQSRVQMGLSEDIVELEPPEHAEEELKKFFDGMKENLTVESLDSWAVKVYMAIIFSHAFENGNGRTARNIYYLLNKDGIPPEQLTQKRDYDALKVTIGVSEFAITHVFEERGMAGFRDEPKKLWPYGISEQSTGNMEYLKFLAAKKVLEEDGVYSEEQKIIDIESFSEDQQTRYEKEYGLVRKEWFAKVLEVCDEHNEYIKGQLKGLLKTSE